MPSEFAQAPATLFADVVSNRIEVTAVLGKLAVMERVALEFAIDRRAMSAKLPGDLANWQLALLEVIETSSIRVRELRLARGHARISRAKPL